MVCKQFSVALISYMNPIICTSILILTDAHILMYTFGLIFSVAPLFTIINIFSHSILYRAYFIGSVSSAGIILLNYTIHAQLGLYLIGLSIFHISEYLLTALYKEDKLSLDSFLLNHSTAYHIAVLAGLFEYLVEFVNLGDAKFYMVLSCVGCAMMAAGDFVRKLSMVTAAHNFDHLVQTEKAQNHQLVQHGVYALSRHPSYVGWYYWSIGTQLLLCNPFCAVAYACAAWKFFDERIEEEECYLLRFFGLQYKLYKDNVGVGIPGIKGFVITPEFNDFLNRVKND